jgi:hypothetical protein
MPRTGQGDFIKKRSLILSSESKFVVNIISHCSHPSIYPPIHLSIFYLSIDIVQNILLIQSDEAEGENF